MIQALCRHPTRAGRQLTHLLVKFKIDAPGGEVASAVPASNGELALLPDRKSASPAAPSPSPAPAAMAATAEDAPPSQTEGGVGGVEEPLGWLPATPAALALRLAELDAALIYMPGQPPGRETMPVGFSQGSLGFAKPASSAPCSVCRVTERAMQPPARDLALFALPCLVWLCPAPQLWRPGPAAG